MNSIDMFLVQYGLANVSLRTFVPGLLVGSTAFLSLHFFLGYIGGSLLAILGRILPLQKPERESPCDS
jgi:hypothetical protein